MKSLIVAPAHTVTYESNTLVVDRETALHWIGGNGMPSKLTVYYKLDYCSGVDFLKELKLLMEEKGFKFPLDFQLAFHGTESEKLILNAVMIDLIDLFGLSQEMTDLTQSRTQFIVDTCRTVFDLMVKEGERLHKGDPMIEAMQIATILEVVDLFDKIYPAFKESTINALIKNVK